MSNDPSLANQRLAADPLSSVWLSASAGTGKTTVLVSRLLRMFLSGVEPSKILCLTYTNAGAVEMQGRIFARAKSWATLGDEALEAELENLLGEISGDELRDLAPRARKLFSRLVDSPLPLKIYTIHAFCQSVLKRFPLEAGVSPHFEVAEEMEAGILLAEAYRSLVAKMRGAKDGEGIRLMDDFEFIAANLSEYEFESLRAEIVGSREKFAALLGKYGTGERLAAALRQRIFSPFPNIPDDFINDPDLYLKNVISKIPEELIRNFIAALGNASTATARENSAALSAFMALGSEDGKLARFGDYKGVFVTGDGAVRKGFIPAEVKKSAPSLVDGLEAEAERIRAAVAFVRCAFVYRMTVAVANVGLSLMRAYARLKDERGMMDFSDLIEATRRLFERPDISGWILYKMDGGVSHVLIDEAQDTSGAQWSIVGILTEQFFTTARSKDDVKSVFSVGDRKQSIFSFQGADIALVEKYRELFRRRVEDGGFEFRDLPMNRSFRSAGNILRVVDRVIGEGARAGGVLARGETLEHVPHRSDIEGYVELVPLAKAYAGEEFYFKPPVEVVEARNPKVDLSGMVAEKIRRIVNEGVRPRDIMVLVQKRSSAKYLLARLAGLGVPTSGQDKMRLARSIVAEDLMSLLKFAVSPYDDLSLCEALKSPLFGLSDDDLFELCFGRAGTVFDAMSKNPEYESTYEILCGLVELGRIKTPFLFFDHVLKVLGGRERFLARFGRAADDILNEFMGRCLFYDRSRMGKSLVDFLRWFESSDMEVKRDMEASGDVVRVMTVHGAKGLEAPVVFLFDANLADAPLRDRILWSDGLPFFKSSDFKSIDGNFRRMYEAQKAAGLGEFYRLLYVAMTRARDRLYVCGWEAKKGEREQSWYGCVREALESFPDARRVPDELLRAKGAEFFDPEVLALGRVEPRATPAPREEKKPPPVPQFFYEKVSPGKGRFAGPTAGTSPLAPPDDGSKAASRGVMIHELLEKLAGLAPGNYARTAHAYPAELVETAAAILQNPEFGFIFENKSYSEVELAYVEDGESKAARIDRLVFAPDAIWIIDYKSDAKAPAVPPENYVRQLGLYKSLVAKIYPGEKIRAAILWTAAPKLVEIQ